MLKKILIALVALWAISAMFGRGGDPGAETVDEVASDSGKATDEQSGNTTSGEDTPGVEPDRQRGLVARVVDGDTLDLANGQTVRLLGIDAPERGDCASARATAALTRLTLGKGVRLTIVDRDVDRYGRLLRYVDIDGADAGLRLIKRGLAIARYDSRDGYGYHPREPRYVAAQRTAEAARCSP